MCNPFHQTSSHAGKYKVGESDNGLQRSILVEKWKESSFNLSTRDTPKQAVQTLESQRVSELTQALARISNITQHRKVAVAQQG